VGHEKDRRQGGLSTAGAKAVEYNRALRIREGFLKKPLCLGVLVVVFFTFAVNGTVQIKKRFL
jgi:hypothetical protein